MRFTHFGEGEYDTTEAAIRALLRETGRERLGARASVGATERPGTRADARQHVLTLRFSPGVAGFAFTSG